MKLEISSSQLSDFLQCPFSFKLKYLLGVPSPESDYGKLGTAVHEVISSFYAEKKFLLSKEEMRKFLLSSFQAFKGTLPEEIFRQGFPLLSNFLSQASIRGLLEEAETEVSFRIPFSEQIIFKGKVDAIFKEKDLIADWKTQRTIPSNISDDIQTIFYSFFYFSQTGRLPTSMIIFLRKKEAFVFHHSQESFSKLSSLLDLVVESVENDQFDRRPGSWCQYCPSCRGDESAKKRK